MAVPPADARRGTRRQGPQIGLAAAGALTAGMALYHFWLPHAFHWGDALTRYPTLRWGLFLINASFSYLLLAGGVTSVAIALKPGLREGAGRYVLLGMAGYWVLNAAWQMVLPMPMPASLAGLRWAFLGFALALALLYLGALGRRDPSLGHRPGGAAPRPGGPPGAPR